MQVQVNTDHNIEGHETFAAQVRAIVESALTRFSDKITRVEVHLSTASSQEGGQDDKRCMLEVRLKRRKPVAVTHQAATLDEGVRGAADKMTRLIESSFGRLKDKRIRRTDPPPPGSNPPNE